MASERMDVPFQIRCPRSWLDRLEIAAELKGISAAAYIRMVTSERMDADGVPRKTAKRKGKSAD
jgi:hypothetical protein